MRYRRWGRVEFILFFASALATVMAGCRTETTPDKRVVKVAAAADLKFAFDDLAAQFEQKHPAIQLQISYGSSGNFFTRSAIRSCSV